MIQQSSSAALPFSPKPQRGQGTASPFAADPLKAQRLLPEAPSRTRSEFQRDRDRIIHCRAFRRLKDKTQVFIYDEGDHFRTRLTHTIEVAQIARSLSRALGLNEDLAEALALAHDLGHPPFGHAGERALDACMKEFGGFDHNAQSLRVVTSLERSYATFDGLNLTWDMLEGLVKHNGPLTTRAGAPLPQYKSGIPVAITNFNTACDLQMWSFASAEAQSAAIADDIAYDSHDVDDGLRAGLFAIEDLKETSLGKDIVDEVDVLYPNLETPRRQHEIARRFITRLIEDVIMESAARLGKLADGEADAVRQASAPVIAFSKDMAAQERELKNFLGLRMYRHPRVKDVMNRAEQGLVALFNAYLEAQDMLPPEWLQDVESSDPPRVARRVCDFIAGMTDRFALQDIGRLTDASPDLRI